MSVRDAQLKRRLIKDGIVITIVLAVLLLAAVLLASYSDSREEEREHKESDFTALNGQKSSILADLGNGYQVNKFYDIYIKGHNSSYTLNREAAPGWLAAMREKYHLNNLSITLSPIADVTGDAFQLKSGILVKSNVALTFGAISDASVYNFIEGLERLLPGFVVMQEVKITHTADLSRTVLLDIEQQHRITTLVNAELHFVWLGIRPKPTETVDETKPPPGPGNGR